MKIPDRFRGPSAWAELRFAIVGPLLASPPAPGKLHAALKRLSRQTWKHPMKGSPIRFAASTIERWYYTARRAPKDPLAALRRNARKDQGSHPSMGAKLRVALALQYERHRGWSCKLHADNLAAMVRKEPGLGSMPSYSTVRRYMRDVGLTKKRTDKQRLTVGAERAAQRLERREVRSYEMEHVNALWHCDFHEGSLDVLTSTGQWERPILFAALDD